MLTSVILEQNVLQKWNILFCGLYKTGGALNDLSKVRFDIVKLPNHFNLEEPEKSFYQAEILVKTFIPKRYIVNLDNF